MKRKLVALLMLAACLLLSLTGCGLFGGGETEDPDPTPPLEPLPSVDGPYNEGDDIASSAFIGTFINTYSTLSASLASDVFEDAEKTPSITCNADGTFALTVMNDMGARTMRTVTGTFTVSDDNAYFTADDNGKEINFSLTFVSESELRFTGDQVDCVMQGDLFERV